MNHRTNKKLNSISIIEDIRSEIREERDRIEELIFKESLESVESKKKNNEWR